MEFYYGFTELHLLLRVKQGDGRWRGGWHGPNSLLCHRYAVPRNLGGVGDAVPGADAPGYDNASPPGFRREAHGA